MSRIFIASILLLAGLGAGCVAQGEGGFAPVGGETSFLELTSAEEQAILEIANTASFTELDDDVALDRRAAQNIVDRRGGGFATLGELDAVPYVGDSALTKLLEYAYATGIVDEGAELVHGIAEGSPEARGVLLVANTLDYPTLDGPAGLDRRAAQNIVDDRGTGLPSLAALDAVSYVGATAFSSLLTYATDNGFITEEPADEDAVRFVGERSCQSTYDWFIVSNPARATTEGKITLHFSANSPYGPANGQVQLETAPNVFTTVATTIGAIPTTQTETFRVSADQLNAAIDAMGWLRFRVNKGTGYPSCSALDLVYNCPSCLLCPQGEEDRGAGCVPVDSGYDYALNDMPGGRCSGPTDTLTYRWTPPAGSDGTLSFDYVVCDGGSATAYIMTNNAGWVDLGTFNTPISCGFSSASYRIPEAYLDAARNEAGEIQVKYYLRDRCIAGVGCVGYNDPCIRRARLTFDAE